MTKQLTCICCPLGCALTVEMDGQEVKSISGYTCKRGEVYGKKEVVAPTRIVTSSVAVKGGRLTRVSVKTREDIPKEKMFECIAALRGLVVQAPVQVGDVILSNVANTGVDIIATRNVS